MTTPELIDYYRDLLIAQYVAKGNARGLVGAVASEVVADQVVAGVRDGFNLPSTPGALSDSAVGKQAEILAAYRGLRRQVFGINIERTYLRFPNYGDTDADTLPGLPDYGDAVTWSFFRYEDAVAPIYELNDSELLRMTQFRARAHTRKMTVKEADDLLFDFFGNNAAVFENGEMALTYLTLTGDPDPLVTIARDTGSLPRPAGVKIGVIYADSISGLFGFQQYAQAHNYTFVGFGLYGTPQPGSFLRYS